MKLPLSNRLMACCSFVRPGDRVADIGCDHGYLSIHLLQSGIASSVIESDVAEGPLQSAMRNAAKFGVRNKMEFFLSDGVASVPQDFTCMVCAGMGADTIIPILANAPWLKNTCYKLILQCQTKSHLLRRYLSQNDWHIKNEQLVRDGHFLYTVMEVVYEKACALTPGQCFLSPALRSSNPPELPEHYHRTLKNLHLSVDNKGDKENPFLTEALAELENDPTLIHLKEAYNGNS